MNKISVFRTAKEVFYDTQAANTEPERRLLEEKIAQAITFKIESIVGFLPIEIRPVIVVGYRPDIVEIADIEIFPKDGIGLTVEFSEKNEYGEEGGNDDE